jgi:hypothetical protein
VTEPSTSILAIIPAQTVRPAAKLRSTRWLVRRSLLGLLMLSGFVVGGVLLMNASIDRDAPGQSQSEE